MDDTTICPVCGESNQCGMAQGKSDCWCFETKIPEQVLAAVPEEDRARRCICQRCAEAATAAGPAAAPDA